MVRDGDPAPGFTLAGADGKATRLCDLKGHYAVVYFYPKDGTPGCTREALDFTALEPEFERLGAQVFGISPDSVNAHAKFRDKHALKVTLLADEEKTAAEAYGVWVEKKLYGRRYAGVERSTFLIGPDGTVLKSWRNVKVPGHAAAVLAALKK